jgi:hypothetical protein
MTTEVAADVKKNGKGGRRNAISGILVGMIVPAVVKKAAKDLGIKLDGDETPEQVSVLLHQKFQDDVLKGANYFKCAECGGGSTDAVEVCPYCGEGGEAPAAGVNLAAEEAHEGAPAPALTTAAEPPPEEAPEEDVPVDVEDEDPFGGAAPKAPLVEEPEADDPHAIDARVIEAAAPAAMVDPGAKPARVKKAKVAPPPPLPPTPANAPKAFKATKTENGRALVPAGQAKPAEVVHEGTLLSEADLDAAKKHYQEAGHEANLAWWRQGRILDEEVFKGEAWRLRKGPDGKPLHKNFEAFCNAELGITPDYAYTQMKAAKYFSAERAGLLEKSKAYLIMKFPEEVRRDIEAHALKGAKYSDLRERLKESQKKEGKTRGNVIKTKAGVERVQKGGRPKTKLAIADLFGKHNVTLFKGPVSDKPGARAEKMSDQPWGRSTTIDGVVETFRILKGAKGLFVEVVRAAPAKKED